MIRTAGKRYKIDALTGALSLTRRHLDESQRAMVAARVATLPDGHRKSGAPIGAGVATQDDAAEMLNVGRRSVQRAREVLDHGAPELVAAVERGEVSVSAAADAPAQPRRKRRKKRRPPKPPQPAETLSEALRRPPPYLRRELFTDMARWWRVVDRTDQKRRPDRLEAVATYDNVDQCFVGVVAATGNVLVIPCVAAAFPDIVQWLARRSGCDLERPRSTT